MSVSNFSFTKDWKEASDFPTHEPDETQVRADMQLLYDELKNYINSQIVVALNNIAAAVENLTNLSVPDNSITYEKLYKLVAGQEAVATGAIRPGAVTSAKIGGDEVKTANLDKTEGSEAVTEATIRNGAVTTAKLYQTSPNQAVSTATIRDGAVTTDKLDQTSGSEAVTEDTIRDGAVTTDKLDQTSGSEAVTEDTIRDGAVTTDKLGDEAVTKDKIYGKKIPTDWLDQTSPYQAVSTATIRNGAVTTAKLDQTLGSQAVSTATIRDDAVTFAKIKGMEVGSASSGGNFSLNVSKSSRGIVLVCGQTGYGVISIARGSDGSVVPNLIRGTNLTVSSMGTNIAFVDNGSTSPVSFLLITLLGTITIE